MLLLRCSAASAAWSASLSSWKFSAASPPGKFVTPRPYIAPMRILCTSDLHLGRASTRLRGAPVEHTSTAEAWLRFVNAAVANQVDAVALGGDVVDQENKFYEALGPLERGVRRLAEHGIPVVAVAGNHDWDVLPDLARRLGGMLHLLGVGGQWERREIATRSGPLVVHGWSFSGQYVRHDPMRDYAFGAEDAPVLGLLHTDLEQPGSSYAPTTLAQLQACRVSCWLIGHIHRPTRYEAPGCPTVLNPGSPQPLDPGEPDAHDAWLVELAQGQPARLTEVPVAAACYRQITVPLDGVDAVSDARDRIINALQNDLADVVALLPGVRVVSARVHLTGRTPVHDQLHEELERMKSTLDLPHGATTLQVERVTSGLRAARDLASLATAGDAAGWLARLVESYGTTDESPSPDTREARQRLRARAADIRQRLRAAKPYAAVAPHIAQLGDEALDTIITQQADRLLDALLQQRTEGA
jgi:DNA repair protein SbcD/Mre11